MHILISNCAGFINTFANSVGLERWGYKYYFVFVVWNVCASALWFLFGVETRGRTLEELDYVFSVPTIKHASYQLTEWLPWFFKRYILRIKSARREPLYHFEGVAASESDLVHRKN